MEKETFEIEIEGRSQFIKIGTAYTARPIGFRKASLLHVLSIYHDCESDVFLVKFWQKYKKRWEYLAMTPSELFYAIKAV